MTGRRRLTKRQKLTQVTREIRRLEQDVAAGIYQIGRLLDELRRSQQWRDGGHQSFAAYLRDEADMRLRVAQRFIRVARNFNEAIATRYGISKLDAALRYLSATPAREKAGDLLATEIRVRGPEGRYQVLTLHQATSVQIDEANKLMMQSRRGGRRIPRRIRAQTDRLAEALRPLAPGAGSGPAVRPTRGRDGGLLLSFKGIAYDQLAAFIEVLSKHLTEGRG